MDPMLQLADEQPCFVTSFERITEEKRQQLRALAAFPGLQLPDQKLEQVAAESGFGAMRSRAEARGQGSHYRKGKQGSHVHELSLDHMEMVQVELQRRAPDLPERAMRAGLSGIVESTRKDV